MPATLPKFSGALPGRHLGRNKPPAEKLRKIIPLAPFLKRYGAAAPPDSVSYQSKAPNALNTMLGNDQWGDCTLAATLHGMAVWRAVVPGGADQPPTDAEAVDQYHAVCGRGDPGCYIPDVLDALRDKGLTAAGRKSRADGYVSVDHTDQLLAKVATYLFGGLHLGINLPRAWYQGAEEGATWDVTNTDIVGGHSIQVVGYDQRGVQVSTWGNVVTLTWAAFADRRWVEECYAVLGQDWYTKEGLDAHGLNVSQLKEALEVVKGGGTPDIPPGPTPTPPGPGGDIWAFDHTWEVFGYGLHLHLGIHSGAALAGPRAINYLKLIQDVWALVLAIRARDWYNAPQIVLDILGDLGFPLGADAPEIARRIADGMRGNTLTDGR